MTVDIKFKQDSPFKAGQEEHFKDVKEVHFNYNGSGRVAFESEDTGCTYDINWLEEFEVTN